MPYRSATLWAARRRATARKPDLRSHREGLQRIQIGLVGLATVLLVVTLANLVIDSARKDNAGDATAAAIEQGIAGVANATAASAPTSTSEPLADLGVTPTADSAAPVVTPSVPDLEPDPRLRERMDQDRDGAQPPSTPPAR